MPRKPVLRISRPRYRFAAMSSAGDTASVWNTVSMPASRASCVLRKSTASPATSIVPESGACAPEKHLISVDLPAPLSPITASTSPGYRSMSAPLRPTTLPKSLVMPRPFSTGCDGRHAFTFLIHWSSATAVITRTPTASTR